MNYGIQKGIFGEDGTKFMIGDIVTIKFLDGGGCGSCTITKITDTGFRFTQDGRKEKTIQYKNLSQIEMQNCKNRRSTNRYDISGQELKEGDVIEIHVGIDKILADHFIVKYGTYQGYCPVDNEYMDSIGFYVFGKNYPDMPIGTPENYAKGIGNIYDNPELIMEFKD